MTLIMNAQTGQIARLRAEGLVPMREAIAALPGNKANKSVHPSTGARWCLRGVRLRNGEVVRLEHVKNGGGRLLTTAAALERFLATVTAGSTTPATDSPPSPTPSGMRRAAERADEKLKAVLA